MLLSTVLWQLSRLRVLKSRVTGIETIGSTRSHAQTHTFAIGSRHPLFFCQLASVLGQDAEHCYIRRLQVSMHIYAHRVGFFFCITFVLFFFRAHVSQIMQANHNLDFIPSFIELLFLYNASSFCMLHFLFFAVPLSRPDQSGTRVIGPVDPRRLYGSQSRRHCYKTTTCTCARQDIVIQ